MVSELDVEDPRAGVVGSMHGWRVVVGVWFNDEISQYESGDYPSVRCEEVSCRCPIVLASRWIDFWLSRLELEWIWEGCCQPLVIHV